MPDNKVLDRNEHPQTDDNGVPMVNNVGAHMPPQPGGDPVWANVWNPDTNEWMPSNEQHSVFGLAEPSHGDAELADPMINVPGRPETYEEGGGTPDVRLNLLDAVRGRGVALQPPTQTIEHVIRTQEQGADSDLVRVRQVQATSVVAQLIEQNVNRKRALIRIPPVQNVAVPLSQNVANPAAGADWSVTVPAGETWQLQTVLATLATSAAVANRVVKITVTIPGEPAATIGVTGSAQAASTTISYIFGVGQTTNAGPTGVDNGSLTPVILPAGSTISSSTTAIQAGDQWSGVEIMALQVPTLVPCFVSPVRMGGAAAASQAWYQIAPGDPPLEVKSESGLDIIAPAAVAGQPVIVMVYEEFAGRGSQPGLV